MYQSLDSSTGLGVAEVYTTSIWAETVMQSNLESPLLGPVHMDAQPTTISFGDLTGVGWEWMDVSIGLSYMGLTVQNCHLHIATADLKDGVRGIQHGLSRRR